MSRCRGCHSSHNFYSVFGPLFLALAVYNPARPEIARADRPLPVAHITGVDYGPFRDGQDPGMGRFPSSADIHSDMSVLKTIANVIRTYSTTNGFDQIVSAAASQVLMVVPGAWLSNDAGANETETDSLITAINQNSNIVFAIVGSEAIL